MPHGEAIVPLSCPDGQNHGAIAKQMHETALEAEQRIFVLEQGLRAAVNRQTIIQVTTAAVTGIPTGLTDFFIGPAAVGGSFTTTFNNTIMRSATGERIGDQGIFTILGAGVYEIGLFASAVASGAVTDNSQRLFRIKQQRIDLTQPSGLSLVQEASILNFETNTGVGTDCCVAGIFRMQATDFVQFTFAHDNAASAVDVPSGTVVWLHRLSDANILAVL